ncbi:MAG: 2-hydroxyacid dehydrogenase [Desulforhopalus sp.]
MKITKINHIEYYPESLRTSLQKLGDYVEYDDIPDWDTAASRLAKTDIGIVEWSVNVDRPLLEFTQPRLKHIVAPLADYSHIDCVAAKEFGITVSNCPGATTIAVAEHLFTLLGGVSRQVLLSDQLVREGKRDYYEPFMHMELHGKTLGILGLGDIGSHAAKLGKAFNMNVIAYNRSPREQAGVKMVDIETLFGESDALFITTSSHPGNDGLVSREMLSLLKPSAYVISIAMPGITDEEALFDLLEQGRIKGAGYDMISEESPLVKSKKTILSPGVAWLTAECLERLFDTVFRNVKSCVDGAPVNTVT